MADTVGHQLIRLFDGLVSSRARLNMADTVGHQLIRSFDELVPSRARLNMADTVGHQLIRSFDELVSSRARLNMSDTVGHQRKIVRWTRAIKGTSQHVRHSWTSTDQIVRWTRVIEGTSQHVVQMMNVSHHACFIEHGRQLDVNGSDRPRLRGTRAIEY